MAKRIKAHFYNINYTKYEPLHKIDSKTMVTGRIIPPPSDTIKEEVEKTFEGVEIHKNSLCNIIFPAGMKKEIHQFLLCAGYQFLPERYWPVTHSIPGGYLYSGWGTGHKTKILPKDLPKSYIRCNNYKKNGYLQTAGVKDILYRPSPFHNHSFKDDFLFLSYSKDIVWEGTWENSVYDEYIFGNDIINVIFGLEKYSPELGDKILKIKEGMVKQYNLYCDEMNHWDGIPPYKKINQLEELLQS